jgi:hypothetical protein
MLLLLLLLCLHLNYKILFIIIFSGSAAQRGLWPARP